MAKTCRWRFDERLGDIIKMKNAKYVAGFSWICVDSSGLTVGAKYCGQENENNIYSAQL